MQWDGNEDVYIIKSATMQNIQPHAPTHHKAEVGIGVEFHSMYGMLHYVAFAKMVGGSGGNIGEAPREHPLYRVVG